MPAPPEAAPSREQALALLAQAGASGAVLRHSLAVERLASFLALQAQDKGFKLDPALVTAAALLHDIARNDGRDHAEQGAVLLRRLGYPKVAAIVRAHMDLPPDALSRLDERAIVYLADKLVLEDRRVRLKERFGRAREKYAHDEEALATILRRLEDARTILNGLGLTEEDCLRTGSRGY